MAESKPNQEGARSSLSLRLVLEFLGGAAGIAAFLTFVGGALMWIRFDALGLPADRAVALLPDPLLLAIGAQSLALPALLGLVAIVVVVVIPDLGAQPFKAFLALASIVAGGYVAAVLWLGTGWSSLAIIAVALLSAAAVGAVLALGTTLLERWERSSETQKSRPDGGQRGTVEPSAGTRPKVTGTPSATLLPALLVTVLGALLAFRVAFELDVVPYLLAIAGITVLAVLAIAANVRSARQGQRSLIWVVFVSFLAVGAAIALARTHNAPKAEPVALLLAEPEEQIAGFLVGETADRVFVAPLAGVTAGAVEISAEPVDSLVSLSRDRVVRMAIRRPAGFGLADAGREQAQTLLEDLLAQQRATRGELPPEPKPVATDDPVRTFAPLLSLHAREPVSPTSAEEFLRLSWIVWSHTGGCRDFSFALRGHAPPERRRIENRIDLRRLRAGGYRHRAGCDHRGRAYGSKEFTRPFARGRPGLRRAEGFFLDLRNRARRPRMKSRHQGQQRVLKTVPVYYERHREQQGTRITYWFFYPFSIPPGGGSNVAHEGDWERISVLVRRERDDRYTPLSVRFHEHDTHHDVAWADVRKAPNEEGLPTRPRAYVARGSHATYRRPGFFTQVLERGGRRIVSVRDEARACPECPLWLTWQTLVDARRQPWYGFGGAWGEVGREASFTGPLGPSELKTLGRSPSPERQLASAEDVAAQAAAPSP